MTFEAVVYVSSALGDPSETDIETLLSKSRARNQDLQITGALPYHDGTFFQYFEGFPNNVEIVYDRIKKSPMHRGIIELMRGEVKQRAFPEWLMGFTRAPESKILQLSNATWFCNLPHKVNELNASEGMELLLQFWNTNRGG